MYFLILTFTLRKSNFKQDCHVLIYKYYTLMKVYRGGINMVTSCFAFQF